MAVIGTFSLPKSVPITVELDYQNRRSYTSLGTTRAITPHLHPRLKFSFNAGNLGTDAIASFLSFLELAEGRTNQFRFSDPFDNSLSATELTAEDSVNYGSSVQGVMKPDPDGSRTSFQVCKVYRIGDFAIYREITRPNADGFSAFVDGIEQPGTLDEDTGEFIFDLPPPNNSDITCQGDFDVLCRFEFDTQKETALNNGEGMSDDQKRVETPEVRIIEVKEEPVYYADPNLPEILGVGLQWGFTKQQQADTSLYSYLSEYQSRFLSRDSLASEPIRDYSLSENNATKPFIQHLITLARLVRGAGTFIYTDSSPYKADQSSIPVCFDSPVQITSVNDPNIESAAFGCNLQIRELNGTGDIVFVNDVLYAPEFGPITVGTSTLNNTTSSPITDDCEFGQFAEIIIRGNSQIAGISQRNSFTSLFVTVAFPFTNLRIENGGRFFGTDTGVPPDFVPGFPNPFFAPGNGEAEFLSNNFFITALNTNINQRQLVRNIQPFNRFGGRIEEVRFGGVPFNCPPQQGPLITQTFVFSGTQIVGEIIQPGPPSIVFL